QEALHASQVTVQDELDKVFYRNRYPLLDWRIPLGIVGALVVAATAAVTAWARRPRRSPLAHSLPSRLPRRRWRWRGRRRRAGEAGEGQSARRGWLMRGEAAAGYLFASPWIVGVLVFT